MTVGELRRALETLDSETSIAMAECGGIADDMRDTFYFDPVQGRLMIDDGSATYEEISNRVWKKLDLQTLCFE